MYTYTSNVNIRTHITTYVGKLTCKGKISHIPPQFRPISKRRTHRRFPRSLCAPHVSWSWSLATTSPCKTIPNQDSSLIIQRTYDSLHPQIWWKARTASDLELRMENDSRVKRPHVHLTKTHRRNVDRSGGASTTKTTDRFLEEPLQTNITTPCLRSFKNPLCLRA